MLINKTDITNDLLRSLIEVCRETLPGQRQFSTAGSETFDEEETSLKTALIDENEVSSYTSPTQLIQREINELALQKEASRIKQKLKSVWSQMLNIRKQTYWKQINNANHAEQFEKWLEEQEPIIPRKYRIKPIRGEPEDQTNIRIEVAKERVKGDIQLLRLRSNNSQKKVIDFDAQMEKEIRNNASGRVLEILLKMWESDCTKEEQKSFNKWRYKEAWLLDYAKNFGKEPIKNKMSHKQQTNKAKTSPSQKRTGDINNGPPRNYAAAVMNDRQRTTSNQTAATNESKDNNGLGHQRYNRSTTQNQNKQSNRNNNSATLYRKSTPGERKYQHYNNVHTNTVYKKNHVTYVGKNARNYFLGGGKPNQGANNLIPNRRYNHRFQERRRTQPRYM